MPPSLLGHVTVLNWGQRAVGVVVAVAIVAFFAWRLVVNMKDPRADFAYHLYSRFRAPSRSAWVLELRVTYIGFIVLGTVGVIALLATA